MSYRNRLSIWMCVLFVCCWLKTTNGQDPASSKSPSLENTFLGSPEAFSQLRDSLTELNHMIKTGKISEELPGDQFQRFLDRIEFGKRRLEAIVNSEMSLHERYCIRRRELMTLRMDQLSAMRETVNARVEKNAKSGGQVVLPRSALERMAEKIGEAQIDHRLRELESGALVEALTQAAKEQQRSPLRDSRIRMAEQKHELVMKRWARAKELHKQAVISKDEVDELQLSVLEAETGLREILEGAEMNDTLNRRIADAAIAQVVSARMQKLLAEEAVRINESLDRSSDLEEVRSESEFINMQIRQLKTRLAELDVEDESVSKNVERVAMLVKQAEKMLSNVDGLKKSDVK